MNSGNAALRVGLFAIAGIIGVLAVILFLSSSSLRAGVPYESYFSESVQGVDIGTAVKFRGVTIGHITDIGLTVAEYPPSRDKLNNKMYRQVVVRFRIDPRKLGAFSNVSEAVAHGLRVQLAPQGITGLAYLELTFVPAGQYPVPVVPWTPQSAVLPSIPSTLAQVQDALERALSSLGKVDVSKALDDLTQLSLSLNQLITSGEAHQALVSANGLLLNLNQKLDAANIPQTTAAARSLMDGPQTRQILRQLDQTTRQLASASGALPALITSSQVAVSRTSETVADLQAELQPLLANLQTTTANLNALTEALKSNPSQALLGAAPPPEEEK
jgi:ABC-type transporter Mla subunit MlaD